MKRMAAMLLGLALAGTTPAKVSFDDALQAYEKDGAQGATSAHAAKPVTKAKPKEKAKEKEHAVAAPAQGAAGHAAVGIGGAEAWGRLVAGNQRHQQGRWTHPNLNLGRLQKLSGGQKPHTAVLSCADSRVPPELLFDQGLGDLFVVRVAGNVAGNFDRASLEYGVEHLGIGLLVVLGHEKCGAVKATMDTVAQPGSEKGLTPDLKALVQEIAPGVKGHAGLDEAVAGNVLQSKQRLLEQSSALRKAVEAGHLKVVTARYDLDSGAVSEVK